MVTLAHRIYYTGRSIIYGEYYKALLVGMKSVQISQLLIPPKLSSLPTCIVGTNTFLPTNFI